MKIKVFLKLNLAGGPGSVSDLTLYYKLCGKMKTFHYYKMYQSGVSMEIEKLYSTVGINNKFCKLSFESQL